jgi:hypothetical protein
MNDAGTFETLAIEQIRAFFTSYGSALIAGDASAIARCYALPTLVLSDAGSLPITTTQAIDTAFHGAADGYRTRGLMTARPVLGKIEPLSSEIVSTDVEWEYLDARGTVAARETYRYLLRIHPNDGIQIQVVIARPAR